MFDNQFYPTPRHIAKELLFGFESNIIQYGVTSVLDPSAGKGDLLSVVEDVCKYRNKKIETDAIEIDENLQHILKGKGYRLVGNDFLKWDTMYNYDLIIMNPPFNQGTKHLLKAIKLIENGGRVGCILNAETIRNPFSNDRKFLIRRLEELGAKIRFREDAFVNAEVKTEVEIALINIDVPNKVESDLFNGLKAEYLQGKQDEENNGALIINDFITAIIDQYNLEIKTGVKLIKECEAFNKISINKNIFDLKIYGDRFHLNSVNDFIEKIRRDYWIKLFKSDEFSKIMTEEQASEFRKRINEFKNYDFTEFNILQLRVNVLESLNENIENAIIRLFDKCSYGHSMGNNKNVHYYDGWKTNKSWKINKKVILPINAYRWYGDTLDYWSIKSKLGDIIKVCSYLDGKQFDVDKFNDRIKDVEKEGLNRKVEFDYVMCDFYKKGTTHITFTDEEVLKKFNRFGSEKKGWLPPSYGKKAYKDMTKEEKTIIDEFEGKKEYEKALLNNQIKLNTKNLIAIA